MAKWTVTLFLHNPTIETPADLADFVAENLPLDLEHEYVTDWKRLPDDADPDQVCIDDPENTGRATVEDREDHP